MRATTSDWRVLRGSGCLANAPCSSGHLCKPSRPSHPRVASPRAPGRASENTVAGNWDFIESEGGTRIVWTYTFGLTSPLAYPLAIPIVLLFKGWLQHGLEAIRAELLA